MDRVIDLYLLSSKCRNHCCNSATLAHMKTFDSIIGPLWKQWCHLGSEFDIQLSFLRWTPSLTAGLKHMWWMWHAAIQRDGSEGKSRQRKNSLKEGWDKKQNICHCKDSQNSHFCPLFYEYANENCVFQTESTMATCLAHAVHLLAVLYALQLSRTPSASFSLPWKCCIHAESPKYSQWFTLTWTFPACLFVCEQYYRY